MALAGEGNPEKLGSYRETVLPEVFYIIHQTLKQRRHIKSMHGISFLSTRHTAGDVTPDEYMNAIHI